MSSKSPAGVFPYDHLVKVQKDELAEKMAEEDEAYTNAMAMAFWKHIKANYEMKSPKDFSLFPFPPVKELLDFITSAIKRGSSKEAEGVGGVRGTENKRPRSDVYKDALRPAAKSRKLNDEGPRGVHIREIKTEADAEHLAPPAATNEITKDSVPLPQSTQGTDQTSTSPATLLQLYLHLQLYLYIQLYLR